MKFNLSLLKENQQEMTWLFLNNQKFECQEDGIPVEYRYWEKNGLKVQFDGKKLTVYGMQDPHFYRGLHLFLQEAEKGTPQAMEKEEVSSFREAGIMLDCSRNGAMSVEMLKRFIELCAAGGMNQIYLYMEEVYEIPEDEFFGAYRGRYTFQELKELDAYGQKAGVELIPTIQTLAHLHTYLRWPKRWSLRDTEDILLTGTKEAEEFVRRMIKNASKPFSTRKIHVGMDEAALLGLGNYLFFNGYQERYTIMMSHLNMVNRICREEGLELMMWSDMFFRLQSSRGDYYDLDESTEFDLPEPVPEDVTLVYWDYYHHKKAAYDKNIKLHQKLTDKIVFAGGGWTWNGLAPNYSKARKTLQEGLSSCAEQGIERVFCTFWFDNGTETPVKTVFYSALYFAQLCYGQKAEEQDLNPWLVQLTGYPQEAYELLDGFDHVEGTLPDNKNADNPSKYLLYQDMLAGIFDGQVEGEKLDLYYQELEEKLITLKMQNTFMDPVFSYYKKLAEVLKNKAMLGVKLRRAYKEGDTEELKKLKELAVVCSKAVWELKEARKEIWFAECRPFGFEVLDIRLGGLKTRLDSGVQRLEEYLDGKVSKLEELEEPMVIYNQDTENPEHRHCNWNLWQDIVSAGNIAGV